MSVESFPIWLLLDKLFLPFNEKKNHFTQNSFLVKEYSKVGEKT